MSEELLATIQQAHRELFERLLDVTADLRDDDWARPTGCPGWDVHDQLAHCVGLEQRLLGAPAPEVAVPELPHITDELSHTMELDVQARRGIPGEELRAEASEAFAARLRALDELDPAMLREPFEGVGGMRGKGSTMLRIRVFDLCAHEQDIRRALGRELDPDGAHGDLVSQQILRGLAQLWPQRLTGPGAVEVEITGPQPAAARIDLDAGDGQQRVTRLRGTLGELMALACGRTDAPDTVHLQVDGDDALAREAVAAAGMTP
jgi:uncharacterized protein (TIGR03083 family)